MQTDPRLRAFCTGAVAALAVLASTNYARPANITFLCAEALQSSMIELLPEFQTLNGHMVNVLYANIGTNAKRVRDGEQADLVIVSPQQWDALRSAGKIIPDVRSVVGRIGIGVFVHKGERHPDISSVEALKRTLLEARTIAVRDPKQGSPVGTRTLALFARLGLSDQIMPKVMLTADRPYEAVISGKAEMGFSTIAEIAASPDADLVGPLPRELQDYTTFVTAIPTNAHQADVARELVAFLVSARAAPVLKSKGVDTTLEQ